MTNYHVVNNAAKITVRLFDNRELDARIIGRDARTDVAVIKIESVDHLKAAPLGDSSQINRASGCWQWEARSVLIGHSRPESSVVPGGASVRDPMTTLFKPTRLSIPAIQEDR